MKPLRKLRLLFTILFLGTFLSTSSYFYYSIFYKPKVTFESIVQSQPFDAIIVPGISVDAGKWGFIMKSRVYWSVFLFKTGVAKNIIFSGSAVYTPYTEAKIMSLYAEQLGIPKEHIFIEDKAEHTTENLYYSYQLGLKKGFKRIGFATDPFQSKKIEPYIKKFKVDVTLIPMVIPVMEKIRMHDFKIESYKAYQLNFVSINVRETKEQQKYFSEGGRIKIE
jgi:uncharacterized SAM-binding protein YcdF (DUF218 family)